ncbi:hypothetical protein MMC16_001285 [Acarospora aff. strigata]|nr:hypothetical protein [Acarospora aff. strigata]
MDGNKQQKTIPTVYNMSSTQAREIFWALEELADAGINTQVTVSARKVANHHAEHVNGESEVTYRILLNVLTETRLILHFISDHYTDGIRIPESEEDKARATFFQKFVNSSLLTKVDNIITFEVIPTMLFFPLQQLTLLMVLPIRNHFMDDLTVIYQLLEDVPSEE